jgi:predicted metalloprotease
MTPGRARSRRRLPRALAVLGAALCALLTLSGCVSVVSGLAAPAEAPVDDAPDGQVPIVGAADDPMDTLARNALADLQTFWSQTLPTTYQKQFQPLAGGYFSIDPENVDRRDYPDGVGCGARPADVENNAFYCQAQGQPHSDSISYDRRFLGELSGQYGRFIPALVMAHEFGHAVQARVGYPDVSIATETQADCFAGAWTRWVADGKSEHSTIRVPELDQVLRGFFLLRDPVGTSPSQQQAHGSYFDRVSAFQEGFDSGVPQCRDGFGADRVYTQGRFTSDQDFATGGNAPYTATKGIVDKSLPEFWTSAFTQVLHGTFTAPTIQPFSGSPPGCAPGDQWLVYCSDGKLVAYDEPELTRPAYNRIGDFAVVTAVSLPYALAARDELGRSTGDAAAVRSAVCLTGWFSAQVYNGRLSSVKISPGDLDESVSFLLQYGRNAQVLPDVGLTGFQLVDLFRNGYLQGAAACDVGVG